MRWNVWEWGLVEGLLMTTMAWDGIRNSAGVEQFW